MSAGSTGFTSSNKKIFLVRMGMMLGFGLLILTIFNRIEVHSMAMTRVAVNIGAILIPLYFLFLGLNAFEAKVVKRSPWWIVVTYHLTQRALKAIIWMGLGAYFLLLWEEDQAMAYWQLGIFSVLVVVPKMVGAYLEGAPSATRNAEKPQWPKIR